MNPNDMFRSTGINIALFKVNSMDIGSKCTIGQTYRRNMFHRLKRNNGFGEDNGDYTVQVYTVQIIDDDDLFDADDFI